MNSFILDLFSENLAVFTLQIQEKFSFEQITILAYFRTLEFSEVELFQIALSMSFIDAAEFTDLTSLDVKLFYFERSLEHKISTAITSSTLQFSTKFVSILAANSIDISAIQVDLNAEFAKLWSGAEISFDFFTEIIVIAGATDLQSVIFEKVLEISEEIFVEISVFQHILMQFGETLDSSIAPIFNLAILTSVDLEEKLENMKMVEFLTEISDEREIEIPLDGAVALEFVMRIAFIDKFIITEAFFFKIEELELFSLTLEELTFDILVTLAETTSYYELVLRDAVRIFKAVLDFNVFQTTILDFFKFQDLADETIEPQLMIALQLW